MTSYNRPYSPGAQREAPMRPFPRDTFIIKPDDMQPPPAFSMSAFLLWKNRPFRSVVYTLLALALAFVILKQSYLDAAGRDYISTLVQTHAVNMMPALDAVLAASSLAAAVSPMVTVTVTESATSCPTLATTSVPQYFQTTPELWPGPMATGKPGFLAQTVGFDPASSYVPNTPLQTSIPINGAPKDSTMPGIFRLMGNLSPYQPAPGFGVQEYPLPLGAKIVQLHMLSRHGSRHPTTGSHVESFGQRIRNATGTIKTSGELGFLNDWEYGLGAEILVPKGRQELFESGVLHAYMYGQLYDPETKIIARTTTQDRMLKSAENFMAGFFGLEWTNNVTLELIIEENNFNNSLAGYLNCPNAREENGGKEVVQTWTNIYLEKATERLKRMVEGYNWTVADTYAAQTLCPYETIAFGSSAFCGLFTYEEWEGFSYSTDLDFSATSGFQSPTGRAVGIGYQQEVIARLKNHTLDYSGSQINTTLDSSEETFPLNQTIYFDFSHDSNIISILAAFGLRQFADPLSATANPGPHNFTVTNLTPFGARLDIEIIETPKPVKVDRKGYDEGGVTRYVHFVLNQRTVPLGVSLGECGRRVDGWCELGVFLKVQEKMEEVADYVGSCWGDIGVQRFGEVTDGRPVKAEEGPVGPVAVEEDEEEVERE